MQTGLVGGVLDGGSRFETQQQILCLLRGELLRSFVTQQLHNLLAHIVQFQGLRRPALRNAQDHKVLGIQFNHVAVVARFENILGKSRAQQRRRGKQPFSLSPGDGVGAGYFDIELGGRLAEIGRVKGEVAKQLHIAQQIGRGLAALNTILQLSGDAVEAGFAALAAIGDQD